MSRPEVSPMCQRVTVLETALKDVQRASTLDEAKAIAASVVVIVPLYVVPDFDDEVPTVRAARLDQVVA